MHPIEVNREIPESIGNRLQFALLKEAIAIVQDGKATPHHIDSVVKYGLGRRLSVMGPFEIFDFDGWDTTAKMYPNITGEPTPPEIMEKLAQGKLGVKSGEGFYHWDPSIIYKKTNLINDIYNFLDKSVNKHEHKKKDLEPICKRL
ncbi:3-hydroxyacyl-CoA dehydrogenase family protein [Photobacterium leiognathi]|uniref:3-hydroxyacyl-CoA dehydrogenase family protein n=1 Tax=Photobacterium leiognathi TaxID=553611 RepID=UPI0034E98A57